MGVTAWNEGGTLSDKSWGARRNKHHLCGIRGLVLGDLCARSTLRKVGAPAVTVRRGVAARDLSRTRSGNRAAGVVVWSARQLGAGRGGGRGQWGMQRGDHIVEQGQSENGAGAGDEQGWR